MLTGDPPIMDDVCCAMHMRYQKTDRLEMGVTEDDDEVMESIML